PATDPCRPGRRDSQVAHRFLRKALSKTCPRAPDESVRSQRTLPYAPNEQSAPGRRVRGPSTVRRWLTVSLRLTRRPLSVPAAMEALEGPGLGGVVLFAGRVRPDATRRGRVVALEYEAHRTLARVVLAELERKVHRTEAFAAARFLIDQLKARAPIWKTERVQPARRRRSRPPSPGGRGAG